MTEQNRYDATPDVLMERFQGRGLKSIILFTLVVHVVVLLGSSVPFLLKSMLRSDTAGMTQEERITAAVQEATVAIREIAEDYGLNPQEISDRFSGARTSAAVVDETPAAAEPEAAAGEEDERMSADRPKSAIEQQLEVSEEGPAMPRIEDDIF